MASDGGSGGNGGGGVDLQKLSMCYSKLFQQQAHFAAEQAALFAKLAAGDAAALDAVSKMPEPGAGKSDGEEGGGKKGKGGRGKKRKEKDPDEPKRPKSGCEWACGCVRVCVCCVLCVYGMRGC